MEVKLGRAPLSVLRPVIVIHTTGRISDKEAQLALLFHSPGGDTRRHHHCSERTMFLSAILQLCASSRQSHVLKHTKYLRKCQKVAVKLFN